MLTSSQRMHTHRHNQINTMAKEIFAASRNVVVGMDGETYLTLDGNNWHGTNYSPSPGRQVATYPRSGTTWTQEMVWLICNNFNFQAARDEPLTKRFPFFEFHMFVHDEMKEQFLSENADPKNRKLIEDISTPVYEWLPSITSQRFIKTHFPMSLLPPSVMKNGAKVIYVARNPSDVVVSYYHLNKLYRTQGYTGNLEKFYNYFEMNLTAWSPYWTHIKEGWNSRHLTNVMFMFYEDMNKDLPATIRKVAKFLEKKSSEEDILKLADHLDIKNFKNNPSINGRELLDVGILNASAQGFIRKGRVNSSVEELTEDLKRRIGRWTESNLADSDIKFPDITK